MNQATKLTIVIFAAVFAGLWYAQSIGVFTLDVNGFFNGTLQSLVAGSFMVPVTIVIYRYFYHRRSKK